MAAPSKAVGYECEFVDQVPEDYFCKQCKHVAREPQIASCCTEVFCKACIEAVIEDKKPCPSCESSVLVVLGPHNKYQVRILASVVRCSLKDRGCQWTGQLQHLDAHLDLTTGDCVYVDVDCPSKCNQKVQKHDVDTHLTNHCPNRDYTCPHCSFKATFREVSEHFEVCRYYPLVCPNRCGASFERDVLEDHMKMCGLQKLQCEFSYAGCGAEFIRDHQKEHMEQNTQKHLALLAADTLRISKEQQETLAQKSKEQQQWFEMKLAEKDSQIKKLEELFEKKLGEQREEFHKQQRMLEEKLEERDQQIKTLEEQHGSHINSLRMEVGIPPFEFTLFDYKENKEREDSVYAPPWYTHPGGYKLQIRLWPMGLAHASGTHLTLYFYLLKGQNDSMLKFPASFTVTLELLNQHRDQCHYTKKLTSLAIRKEMIANDIMPIIADFQFIPNVNLIWNEHKQTQFLKYNCLKFRISEIVVQ